MPNINYLEQPAPRANAPTMRMSVSIHESTQQKLNDFIECSIEQARKIQILLDEQNESLVEMQKLIDSLNE